MAGSSRATSYTPSPLSQPPITADEQGQSDEDNDAQASRSEKKVGNSGNPELHVVDRRKAAQVRAATHAPAEAPETAQLRKHFENLKKPSADPKQKIRQITSLLNRHPGSELAYQAFDMCESLVDKEKKCMVYMALSKYPAYFSPKAENFKLRISLMIDSLISCMKEEGIRKATKEDISEIISSRMLSLLENLPTQDKPGFYKTLLKNLPHLLETDKQEPFAREVLNQCAILMNADLPPMLHLDVMSVITILIEQIQIFPANQKPGWVRRMTAILPGYWEKIQAGGVLKKYSIKILSSYRDALDAQEREKLDSTLTEWVKMMKGPSSKKLALLWINNPTDAERIERETAQSVGAQTGQDDFSEDE